MSEPNSERIITPMPPSLVKAVDDYRFEGRFPSRSEAIRWLIEIGLAAAADPTIADELRKKIRPYG